MLAEIIQAFVLIFFAEMGDKTQILAMAFATRYSVKKVLIGIAIGSFLNHGLAVVLGSYLSTLLPIEMIQLISGFAFIGFALWTLKTEDDDSEEESKVKYGPVVTVAMAFFIGELGDKTQLAAITLATDATYPFVILLGTVMGMLVTGGIGILIGKKMGDKIPEGTIKLISATVFMFFGLMKIYTNVPEHYLSLWNVILFVIVILTPTVYLLLKLRSQTTSRFKQQAQLLKEHYQLIEQRLNDICLGEESCKTCDGSSCEVGYAKKLIDLALSNQEEHLESFIKNNVEKKPFNQTELSNCLAETIYILDTIKVKSITRVADELRKHLELVLLNDKIAEMVEIDIYLQEIENRSGLIRELVQKNLDERS